MPEDRKPELKIIPTIADVDPFDPNAFSLSQADMTPSDAAKRVLKTVPVRKPKKEEFFRVHADPEFTSSIALLEHDREFFLVDRAVRAALKDEIKPAQIYTCMTRAKVVFLWPVRLPGENGKNSQWWQSAHDIAREAQRQWIRCVANQNLGGYEQIESLITIAEPEWPDKSLRDLCAMAFGNQRISDLDHIVVKQLQGRI